MATLTHGEKCNHLPALRSLTPQKNLGIAKQQCEEPKADDLVPLRPAAGVRPVDHGDREQKPTVRS